MQNDAEKRLGTEKMLPLIIRMSLPVVAAQLVNLLYSVIDRIYIGHIPEIGGDALAGVGVTSSVIILIAAFASFVSGGGAPLAAIALGKGDRDRAEKILGNGTLLLLVFTVITTAATFVFLNPMLKLIGASDNTIIYAEEYLSVYLIGTVFVQLTVGLNNFITSQGKPAVAMISVLIGAVLNIVMDPLFIYTFGMGVKGAALATVISQACSCAWVLVFLMSDNATLKLKVSRMKPEWNVIFPMLALGISPFVMASTESLVGFVLNSGLRDYGGDLHVAAFTVIQGVMQIASIPASGFAQGVSPVISYNYGAKHPERVKEGFRIFLAVMFFYNLSVILAAIIFPGTFAAMFTDDRSIIALVSRVMPTALYGMTLFGLQRACQSTFVALGQAKTSLFIALLRKVLLLIPLALILPSFMGVTGIYTAESVADGVAAITCTFIFAFSINRILATGSEIEKTS